MWRLKAKKLLFLGCAKRNLHDGVVRAKKNMCELFKKKAPWSEKALLNCSDSDTSNGHQINRFLVHLTLLGANLKAEMSDANLEKQMRAHVLQEISG
jgi:hypothetical protein